MVEEKESIVGVLPTSTLCVQWLNDLVGTGMIHEIGWSEVLARS
jgi:hypothetical protein